MDGDEREELQSVLADASGLRPHRAGKQTYDLELTFSELALVYKALQAVRALGALPPQDVLLNDTISLVDRALSGAL